MAREVIAEMIKFCTEHYAFWKESAEARSISDASRGYATGQYSAAKDFMQKLNELTHEKRTQGEG